jgi:23S rRNA (adenine2030-N6)-methyltransferase
MNYRHIYHAGNFCDIIKHLTLVAILKNLLKKPKPFAVLDGFAGVGIYDITSEAASKTRESELGVRKLFEVYNALLPDFPPLLNDLIQIIRSTGSHDLYPGSPLIIKNLIRPIDQLIACELHKQDYEFLKNVVDTGTHNLDAYLALKAFLPFEEKRGLIFLDPPFEKRDEFSKLVRALKMIKMRAENICTLIWYPVKVAEHVQQFYTECKSIGFKEILKIEFELSNKMVAPSYDLTNMEEKYYMNKCGLLIINPPYIHDELQLNLDYIVKQAYNMQARYIVELL